MNTAGRAVDVLTLWTIYARPRDFPRHFVVRAHHVYRGASRAADIGCLCETLLEARRCLPRDIGVNLGREPGDDPFIVETWI